MLRRRSTAWVLFVSSCLALVTLAAIFSCGNSSNSVGLAAGCAINSDCNSPLVCAFGLCHEACAADRDCPTGARCVPANGGKDSVCLLATESSCLTSPSQCAAGLVCASDKQCRSTCPNGIGCKTDQKCGADNACYDVTEDAGSEASAPTDAGTDSGTPTDAGVDTGTDAGSVDAGPLGYFPSNFDLNTASILSTDGGPFVDGGIAFDLAGALAVNVNQKTACDYTCLPVSPGAVRLADGTLADVYVMKSLIVGSNVTLYLSNTRPVIFVVNGDVDIQGGIDVTPALYYPVAGGWSGLNNQPHGPGAGANGLIPAYPSSGAGGASYCGLGGKGGAQAGNAALPGSLYGSPEIIPLTGGSGGGSDSAHGGAGGGALQITSRTSILIRNVGSINAGGGGGARGGGGSGGSVVLEAPSVVIQGNVTANGGGGGGGLYQGVNGANASVPNDIAPLGYGGGGNGSAGAKANGADGLGDGGANLQGGGGGGAGRIRINTADGGVTITGIMSPNVAPATTCATTGKLVP